MQCAMRHIVPIARSKTAHRTFNVLSVLVAVAATFFTRDLVSEPANVLYPAEFARRARELSKLGVKVEILGETEMKKLGMNVLLAVGQ